MSLIKKLMIGVIAFSATACSHNPVYVFVPLEVTSPCEFEKFTPEEIATISEPVGRKIFKNQRRCEINAEALLKKIELHNKVHSSKD